MVNSKYSSPMDPMGMFQQKVCFFSVGMNLPCKGGNHLKKSPLGRGIHRQP